MTAFDTWGDPIRVEERAANGALIVLARLRDVAASVKGSADGETIATSLTVDEVRKLLALEALLRRVTR